MVTPGPWELRPDPKRGIVIVSVRGVETKPIAYVQFAEDGLANARLIAAAPELLAALKALFADYKALADSGDAGHWSLEGLEVGQQALAAIAKAEGQ